jgi:tetratricopeptide (TPR) repeat protein
VLQAWVLFHNGEFQQAAAERAWAQAARASRWPTRPRQFTPPTWSPRKKPAWTCSCRWPSAPRPRRPGPQNANAWYWHAYALGRYSQGISVAKALAQGLGGKVKESLEKAIALSPKHADARIALGTFHAEVIDKVGALIGGMTYGAKKDTGLQLFQEALRLNPGSAIGMIEYANALVMLEGDKKCRKPRSCMNRPLPVSPDGAMERLDVAMARVELEARKAGQARRPVR